MGRTSLKDSSVELGMTLLEVLFALVISGIFLTMGFRLLVEQWLVVKEYKNKLEVQYTLVSTQRVIMEVIQTSRDIEWAHGVLIATSWDNPDTKDYYFINDLDGDGNKDLYWRHLGVVNPLVSGINEWECQRLDENLWKVFIKAQKGEETGNLTLSIGRKV